MMENQDETSLSKKQKPSFVAQHILSIVEDCFSQVEFAVTLPVGSASVHVDQPLSETLQAHRILEERFVNLQDVKQESEEEQSRMSTKAGSKGKGKLRREIKKSITDILRLFKPHIGILSSLRTEQGVELSWSESLLIRELNIYQSLVVKRLTSEHEWPMQNMLDLNLKEEEEVAATLKQVNVEKNEILEGQIEDLLHKFDKDKEEIQAKLELTKKEYDEVMEDTKKLKKYFQDLELECNQIHEKRRLAEEKKREEIRELELKTKAAITVQAWWRGCSTRKALKNKDKGKKKVKTKKGKGKKTK
ncbi:uncharacterized protein LOC101173946 isoform X4 [Oryzias latipes]|uniref:uncharacterized protein LOC101173946 isoform X4 n=1 Tax=Oryzias latipes TaxID=8090 RepID=UPI0009DA3B7C|nr:uncharacterized protein LOC101173946 isoform X4 [Oryzias latipes]